MPKGKKGSLWQCNYASRVTQKTMRNVKKNWKSKSAEVPLVRMSFRWYYQFLGHEVNSTSPFQNIYYYQLYM